MDILLKVLDFAVKSSIPQILIVFGLVFLLLSLVEVTVIRVPRESRKPLFAIGTALILLGITISVPSYVVSTAPIPRPTAAPSPPVAAATNTPTFIDLFTSKDTTRWINECGDWKVTDGRYYPTKFDPNNNCRGLGVTTAGETTWKHYLLEADVFMSQSNSVALLFRAENAQNGCLFVFNPAGDSVLWQQLIDNYASDIQPAENLSNKLSYDTVFSKISPIHLAIRTEGNTYRALVNGIEVSTTTLGKCTQGKIGLVVNPVYGTSVYWSQVKVTVAR